MDKHSSFKRARKTDVVTERLCSKIPHLFPSIANISLSTWREFINSGNPRNTPS